MGKNQFLISIIVPTYNRASLLKKTLLSIQAQSYTEWECIVVDDGSFDETQSIVTEFLNVDARFIYKQRSKERVKGAPSCRNIGLEMATGDLVLFFDSDDLLTPETLHQRIIAVKEKPDFDFWVFQTIRFYEKIGDNNLVWNRLDKPTAGDLLDFLAINPVWHTSGPLFSRKFLIENKLYYTEGTQSWQDWEFHIRVLLQNPNYFKFSDPRAAVYQRFHDNETINKRASLAITEDRIETCFMLIEEFRKHKKLKLEVQRLFFKLFYFILSREVEMEGNGAIWKRIKATLPFIKTMHIKFWKHYLIHTKKRKLGLNYKKKKLFDTLKEVYFYKQFPVDDFSNRTWYKNTMY